MIRVTTNTHGIEIDWDIALETTHKQLLLRPLQTYIDRLDQRDDQVGIVWVEIEKTIAKLLQDGEPSKLLLALAGVDSIEIFVQVIPDIGPYWTIILQEIATRHELTIKVPGLGSPITEDKAALVAKRYLFPDAVGIDTLPTDQEKNYTQLKYLGFDILSCTPDKP
jgi:hypothetical protein